MATLVSRSHVWTEAKFLEEAAFDFSETESMLKIAEDLCGPYVWGEHFLSMSFSFWIISLFPYDYLVFFSRDEDPTFCFLDPDPAQIKKNPVLPGKNIKIKGEKIENGKEKRMKGT